MADAINIIRESLITYDVYDETNGSSMLAGSASVDLPELEYMTTEVKGAGILGSYDAPILASLNNLTATFHWRTIHSDWANLVEPYAHSFACRGALQHYDSGTGVMKVAPVCVRFRGRPTKGTLGKFEPGEQNEAESEFSLDRLRIEYNGAEIVEIDKLNFIFRINGVDYASAIRDALSRS